MKIFWCMDLGGRAWPFLSMIKFEMYGNLMLSNANITYSKCQNIHMCKDVPCHGTLVMERVKTFDELMTSLIFKGPYIKE